MQTQLKVNQFQLLVHLGVGDEERSRPQEVRVDITIDFSSIPEACKSDDVRETIDYSVVCDRLKKELESRSFKTIEFMATEAVRCMRAAIDSRHSGQFALTVQKINAPVVGLLGGTNFTIRGEL